jgi:hypothetical protein
LSCKQRVSHFYVADWVTLSVSCCKLYRLFQRDFHNFESSYKFI